MPMTHIIHAQSGWTFLMVDRPACPCPKRSRFVAGIYAGPAAPEKIAPRDP